VGYSNGAVLTYRIGAEIADLVTAIAPFAGSMSAHGAPEAPIFDARPPRAPVSLIAVHGTADPWVPCGGKEKTIGLGASFSQLGRFWAVAAGGRRRAERRRERRSAVIVDEYADCARGAGVAQVTLVGWNHEWPGPANTKHLPPDHPLYGYDAAEVIW